MGNYVFSKDKWLKEHGVIPGSRAESFVFNCDTHRWIFDSDGHDIDCEREPEGLYYVDGHKIELSWCEYNTPVYDAEIIVKDGIINGAMYERTDVIGARPNIVSMFVSGEAGERNYNLVKILTDSMKKLCVGLTKPKSIDIVFEDDDVQYQIW